MVAAVGPFLHRTWPAGRRSGQLLDVQRHAEAVGVALGAGGARAVYALLYAEDLSSDLARGEAAAMDVDVVEILQQVGFVEWGTWVHACLLCGSRRKREDDACRDAGRGRTVDVRDGFASAQGTNVAEII